MRSWLYQLPIHGTIRTTTSYRTSIRSISLCLVHSTQRTANSTKRITNSAQWTTSLLRPALHQRTTLLISSTPTFTSSSNFIRSPLQPQQQLLHFLKPCPILINIRTFSTVQPPFRRNSDQPSEHYDNLELVPGPLATRKRIKEQVLLDQRIIFNDTKIVSKTGVAMAS